MKISNLIEKLKIISIILFFCFMFCGNVSAETEGSVYVAGVTKYLWRGQVLYRKGALQPGLDLNYKKLSLGLWGSYNLADNVKSKKQEFGEADVTISLSDSYKKLGYSVGYTYYTFPSPVASPSLSSEYFIGLSADVFLSPGLTMYYDVAQGDGVYAELTLSCPFKLGIDFSLDVSAGYNAGQWGYLASPTVLGLTLGTTFSFGPIDISPALYGQQALDKKYKNGNKDVDGYISLSTAYNF